MADQQNWARMFRERGNKNKNRNVNLIQSYDASFRNFYNFPFADRTATNGHDFVYLMASAVCLCVCTIIIDKIRPPAHFEISAKMQ